MGEESTWCPCRGCAFHVSLSISTHKWEAWPRPGDDEEMLQGRKGEQQRSVKMLPRPFPEVDCKRVSNSFFRLRKHWRRVHGHLPLPLPLERVNAAGRPVNYWPLSVAGRPRSPLLPCRTTLMLCPAALHADTTPSAAIQVQSHRGEDPSLQDRRNVPDSTSHFHRCCLASAAGGGAAWLRSAGAAPTWGTGRAGVGGGGVTRGAHITQARARGCGLCPPLAPLSQPGQGGGACGGC